MSVEYATTGRTSPFPARWGQPPDEEHRTAWALSHIRAETLGRTHTRRRAQLHARRYDPHDGPEAA